MLGLLLILMLLVSGLAGIGWVVMVRIGRHLRGNPDAVRSLIENLVMPVIGTEKPAAEESTGEGAAEQA